LFDLGTQELIVIFIVALLVFGPKRLPELARTLGRGMNELKAALRGVKESIEESEITEEIKKARSVVEEELIKNPLEVYTEEEKNEKVKAHKEVTERPAEEEKKVDG
jgi:sec-independent protein translocase protein TatB